MTSRSSTASSSVSRSATLPLAPIEPLSEISVQIPAPTVELSSPTQSEPHPRLSDRVLPVRPPSVTKMIAEGSYTLHPLRADEPSPLEAAVAELRGELEVLRGGLAAADERGARLRGSVAGIQEGLESLAARCAALEKASRSTGGPPRLRSQTSVGPGSKHGVGRDRTSDPRVMSPMRWTTALQRHTSGPGSSMHVIFLLSVCLLRGA